MPAAFMLRQASMMPRRSASSSRFIAPPHRNSFCAVEPWFAPSPIMLMEATSICGPGHYIVQLQRRVGCRADLGMEELLHPSWERRLGSAGEQVVQSVAFRCHLTYAAFCVYTYVDSNCERRLPADSLH